jgi:hypothetical protein
VCVLVVVFALSAAMQAGAGQAAGEPAPGSLTTQIQGLVSSALDAVATQPLSDGSANAENAANEAVALAEHVAADAVSNAPPINPQRRVEEWPTSAEAAAPSNSDLSARERSEPARPRRALRRARPHAPISGTKTPVAKVPSSAWYGGSGSTAETSPGARTQAAGAAPRPQRSAVPERPRFPGPAPPRPDASSAGQSSGQNTPVPSLLAALAGLLFIIGFHFLPRLLPLPAFRKPRRIVLPPWHPG